MASTFTTAVIVAIVFLVLVGLVMATVRVIQRTWTFIDREDVAAGIVLVLVLLVIDTALFIAGLIPAAVIVFALIPLTVGLYFESGTLSGADFGHVVKRGLRRRTWEGPGHYLVARRTEVRKIMLVAHAINVPKRPEKADDHDKETDKEQAPPAREEFWALSSDRIRMNVSLLCKYQLEPAEADDPQFHHKLWILGTPEVIRERVRPLVEMALHDVIGRYTALDAATWNREPVREALEIRLAPLFSSINLALKVVVLGAVVPEDEVRRSELHMRELEQLESSMGTTGLAVHRIDALEKAGVVVVPSDPSILLAAQGGVPPPPPSS
jgi:regulator of protease activity HflC (stomatin/prohibitin superfamily)